MRGLRPAYAALRGTAALAVTALVIFPFAPSKADPPSDDSVPTVAARKVSDIDRAPVRVDRWQDTEWGLSLVPPAGWQRSPQISLNPITDPPDPVFEVVRFQLRLGDASLYSQPIAPTNGLMSDAGAVLSVGLARVDSGLVGTRPDQWETTARIPGFVAADEDLAYDGMRTFTRYFYARATDRIAVVRLVAGDEEWPVVEAVLFAALRSFRAEPDKPNGPVAQRAPEKTPAPAVEQEAVDPTVGIRAAIIAKAASMLGIPYVWGGNSTATGMDCSAWVSRVWGVDRYSTDSIWQVSFPIAKEQLRAGDALDLTTGRDPKHLGHIRLFEAWANAEHTTMWVYEETPPRSVHRVVAYDDRYQPIRLFGLSGAGATAVVPGTVAPQRTSVPRPTARPTPRATPRPSIRVIPMPSGSVRPFQTRVPTATPTPTPR